MNLDVLSDIFRIEVRDFTIQYYKVIATLRKDNIQR